MRYLLLVYEDERRFAALPPSERQALVQACCDNDAALRQSGYLLAVEPLGAHAEAVTVSRRGSEVAVTADLATPADARLRAVVTLQARDLNEAIQVAMSMPQARLGPIEVRPLQG